MRLSLNKLRPGDEDSNRMSTLADLNPGSRARLIALGGQRSFRRRLMEHGLLPGTELRLLRRADLGGVLEVEFRGSRLTLRTTEAREVEVQVEDPRSNGRPR